MNDRNDSQTFSDTSSVKIADAAQGSVERTKLVMTNTSTTAKITITLSDQAAVAGKGIVLNPSGFYAESTDSGYTCYQGIITAVSDTAGGTLAIVEGFKEVRR